MSGGFVSMSRLLAATCLVVAVSSFSPAIARAEGTATVPFVAADGAPETREPLAPEDAANLGAVFGVVQMNDLAGISTNWSVRMYGIAGGDPAANGLMTYLAFVSAHDGSGFLIGDFRAYRVITASPGRIDLEIDEDVMNENGELALITRRVIVSWTEMDQESSPNPEYPATVTVTPAQ